MKYGVRNNLQPLLLLVLINGFVGAMVGLERSVFPQLARSELGVASTAAVVAFLISFGATKSLGNLLAGHLADRFGRRRVLLAGWLVGLPVPVVVILAPSWGWIVAANALLGINQALCWSVTVIMKIDLAGPERRGLVTAANEWAGYVGVAAMAALTGYLAGVYGLHPTPFYPGLALPVIGLVLALFVEETREHARGEDRGGDAGEDLSAREVFARSTWRDRTLFGAAQAGLMTNLKDGVLWALIPLHLDAQGASPAEVGMVAAIYPVVWGFLQLGAGPLSDSWRRKPLIVLGLASQAAGLALFAAGQRVWHWSAAAAVIGLGTALVYPVLLAVVSDRARGDWRASSLGVYRMWRDAGYVLAGATLALALEPLGSMGVLAVVASLCALAAVVAASVMAETRERGAAAGA